MDFSQRLVAHRGWQRRFPENTLAGIQAALIAGARYIEIDIQVTTDHIAVLCHDRNLQRVCNVDRDICTLAFSELAGISAYEPKRLGDAFFGTPLSALTDLVELLLDHPEAQLFVEIKTESLQQFGARVVLDAVLPHLQSIRERCYVISFDLPVLVAARDRDWALIAPVLTSLQQLDSATMEQLNPEMIFCNWKHLRPGTIRERFRHPVALYEIDSYDDARRWLDEGAALIETFAIGELLAAHQGAAHE